jgi:hypothetical protein
MSLPRTMTSFAKFSESAKKFSPYLFGGADAPLQASPHLTRVNTRVNTLGAILVENLEYIFDRRLTTRDSSRSPPLYYTKG